MMARELSTLETDLSLGFSLPLWINSKFISFATLKKYLVVYHFQKTAFQVKRFIHNSKI